MPLGRNPDERREVPPTPRGGRPSDYRADRDWWPAYKYVQPIEGSFWEDDGPHKYQSLLVDELLKAWRVLSPLVDRVYGRQVDSATQDGDAGGAPSRKGYGDQIPETQNSTSSFFELRFRMGRTATFSKPARRIKAAYTSSIDTRTP